MPDRTAGVDPQGLTEKPADRQQTGGRVNLSLGTVTDILNRVEQGGVIKRVRDERDRRRARVGATKGAGPAHVIPAFVIKERFVTSFAKLQDWEQTMLLASSRRVAAMMDAEGDRCLAPCCPAAPCARAPRPSRRCWSRR
ncbi:MAG: hypothetical protein P8164_11390 [Gammaproteobacteria bacterium]|jgi:hypothetical protein